MLSNTRDLKIKAGSLKRIYKELLAYEKEAEKQQAKIDALIASNTDEHTVRKQKEVLKETTDILPDCQVRLKKAHYELDQLLSQMASQSEFEEYQQAKIVLEEASKLINY